MICKCEDDRNQFKITSGMWCPVCKTEEIGYEEMIEEGVVEE